MDTIVDEEQKIYIFIIQIDIYNVYVISKPSSIGLF